MSSAETTTTSLTPYHWQHGLWRSLDKRFTEQRFPHALLVTGIVGVGKSVLANAFAARMLCQSPVTDPDSGAQRACGNCKQCSLVTGEGHPDIRYVAPESGRVIKVDQIRELITFAQKSPQVGRNKVIILDSADRLNISAANALLKTLEEPVEDTFLLLLHRAGRPLLPTIRSRCQVVRAEAPPTGESIAWLQTHCDAADDAINGVLAWAGGAPLAAKAMLDDERLAQRNACLEALQRCLKREIDLPSAAKPFQKMNLEDALDLLLLWAHDLVRASVSRESVQDQEAATMLCYLAGRHPADALHDVYHQTLRAREGLSYNLNPELELMQLLEQWQQLMRGRKKVRVA